MAIYEPPNNYFNNINFNTDFYTIPNDELSGISAAYGNNHYLQIGAGTIPRSQSIGTFFAGGINVGYGINTPMAGYIQAQYINCQYSMSIANVYSSILFESNVPLSTKYQTNLLASKFTLSKQYPPISLSTDPTTLISGQAYGNGNYTVTASSIFSGQEPMNAFKYPYVDGTYSWTTTGNSYTSGSGAFIGGSVTNVLNPSITGIYGEWMQIYLPSALTLKSYTITGRKGVGGSTYNPSAWTLAASMNGGTWYQIDSRSNVTWSTSINSSYTFTPSDPTYGTYDWLYYRLIVTNTNGYVLATVMQLQLNMYSSTDINANALTTGGVAIGNNASTYLTYPTTFVNIGDTLLGGNASCSKLGVGIQTPIYGLDVVSTNGCRIQSTTASSGYLILQGATSSAALGSINFYDGGGGLNGTIGGALVNGSYINMNSVFGLTLGYSINGNLLASGSCGIGTASFNTNAIFDVGGTTTSTKYSFLNGLRISGVDANTIYQNITTNNINITTSGTGQSIGFNIGNGTNIGTFNSAGLQIATSKGIGIGISPPGFSGIAIAGTTGALVNISGQDNRISLNNDAIRLAYVNTTPGVYSSGSILNDFVILNTNGRILFNPNAAAYSHAIMTTSGTGITNFYNTTTGALNASINGDGVITCVSITANSATVKNSLTLTGGTPLSLTTAINASGGTQVSNYVTVAPTGYLLWGGGNNSAVTSYSAGSGTSYSIRGDYAIIGGGFISYSDKRIKRDIKPIENSLDIIEKIEPKNYNIIETAENRYGFIAQEVEEVIPSAVNLAHDFIPNIFDYGTYDDKIITFDNKNNLEIVEGDEIKINYESCRVEEVFNKNTFRIHKKLEVDETKKVFIMGTKVNDFKCINYDMITSINTAAIKELYDIIKIQKQQIAELMSKFS